MAAAHYNETTKNPLQITMNVQRAHWKVLIIYNEFTVWPVWFHCNPQRLYNTCIVILFQQWLLCNHLVIWCHNLAACCHNLAIWCHALTILFPHMLTNSFWICIGPDVLCLLIDVPLYMSRSKSHCPLPYAASTSHSTWAEIVASERTRTWIAKGNIQDKYLFYDSTQES